MDRCLSENEILEAMDTWPKYGCMPDGRFIRLTKENEQDYVPYVHYDDMVKVVKGTPSLDVAPVVHAHWIKAFFPGSVECGLPVLLDATCSHCDFKMEELYSYCPNCGAIMDEEVE